MRKERYTQVHLEKLAYTHRLADQKDCTHTHALSQNERHVYLGKLSFGPKYLVHGILVHGILIHGIGVRYMVPGI